MRYLLDTNILSDLVRNPHGPIAGQIRKVGEANICTSIIVAAELRYGVARREAQRLTKQLEAILSAMDVLPFEAPADTQYGLIRAQLERDGKPIGGNDLLIGAHASALGHTLVTDNVREFGRIQGLRCESWLRPV